MTTQNTKAPLTTIFAGSIILANVLAAKLTWFELPGLGGVAVPAGFVAFGVAYLASDLLVEYHGKDYAASVVNGTIITLIVGYGLIFLAIWMPTAPFYGGQSAFVSTLGNSASIVLASVIALGVAQHFDVRLFAGIKARTNDKYRWLRNCGSTFVSQAIDTVIFITLGFAIFPALGLGGNPMWGWSLISIILGQYIVKLGVAGIDTIPFYLVTEVIENTESTNNQA